MVYKPHVGERPLWDFPTETLALREVLTYEVSAAMGLGVVPETVIAEGPLGTGSVQRYLEFDRSFDVLAAIRSGDDRLWSLAVLDLVTNNADRKLGHIVECDGQIYGIDHGLTFHPEDKLRTVLWSLAGRPVPPPLLDVARELGIALDGSLGDRIADLLGEEERRGVERRTTGLLEAGVHPPPPVGRPPLPWPLY